MLSDVKHLNKNRLLCTVFPIIRICTLENNQEILNTFELFDTM